MITYRFEQRKPPADTVWRLRHWDTANSEAEAVAFLKYLAANATLPGWEFRAILTVDE